MNAEDLMRLQPPNKRSELVRGVMIVHEPAGFCHGHIAMRLGHLIAGFVDDRKLGWVVAAETGFTLARNPDTVRAADAAFVRAARVPNPVPTGFHELAPDLVVEVLSPNDRPADVLLKVADWLKAGTALVWVVDPERRSARVYRTTGPETTVGPGGSLDGEDVLPGFACPLETLW